MFSSSLSLSLSLSLSPPPYLSHTAPTGIVDNITVERNDKNTILIVQWDPYLTPDGEDLSLAVYDIEYRESGSDSSAIEVVNGTLGIIRGLSNAQSYEVNHHDNINS